MHLLDRKKTLPTDEAAILRCPDRIIPANGVNLSRRPNYQVGVNGKNNGEPRVLHQRPSNSLLASAGGSTGPKGSFSILKDCFQYAVLDNTNATEHLQTPTPN
ncbi:hypothetical protein PGT21_024082 [Puccinia graminis f. sp. tritici]|uniref:Uncharacterized protein n=1 Tax=Puccinia graminis f. sp. tritici TaxID=56615 RepID=A0A5B0PIS7_PUCGR|nr:hypothetical protein PGT21_024082 [Puccinia graminis f. sp. tritici]